MSSSDSYQDQLFQRYLQKKLSTEELNQFETELLENPDTFLQLQEAEATYAAFKKNRRQLAKKFNSNSAAYKTWIPVTAIAACLLLSVSFLLNNFTESAATLNSPIVLQTFRGQDLPIVSASGEPRIQLRIDVGPPVISNGSVYTVRVIDSTTQNVVSTQSNKSADAEGWLLHILDNRDHLSGRHTVEVIENSDESGKQLFVIDFEKD